VRLILDGFSRTCPGLLCSLFRVLLAGVSCAVVLSLAAVAYLFSFFLTMAVGGEMQMLLPFRPLLGIFRAEPFPHLLTVFPLFSHVLITGARLRELNFLFHCA